MFNFNITHSYNLFKRLFGRKAKVIHPDNKPIRLITTKQIERGLHLIDLPTGPVTRKGNDLYIDGMPHAIWRKWAKRDLTAEGYKIYLYDLDAYALASWYQSMRKR